MTETESRARLALESLIAYAQPDADAKTAVAALYPEGSKLSRAFELDAQDIMAESGLSKTAAEAIDLTDELARYVYTMRQGKRPRLSDAESAGEYFSALLRGRHIEYCYAACLDSEKRLIRTVQVAKGTFDATDVYIRDVVKVALSCGARYAILAHNHPGGTAKPSQEDKEITLRTAEALPLIGCELLEHIIVTNNEYVGILKTDR